MTKKRTKGSMHSMAYILSILVLTINLVIFIKFLGFGITGFAIFDAIQKPANENAIENIPAENNDNKNELTNLNYNNINNTINQNQATNNSNVDNQRSGGSSSGGGGGGSGNSASNSNQFRGYRLMNLGHGLSLWMNQQQISTQDAYFQGIVRLSLYKTTTKIIDFDININDNKDLRSLFSDTSQQNKKSIINLLQTEMFNVDFFIPREGNFTQIRICNNASSLEQVRQNCSAESEISEEIITLLNETLEISQDEMYFVLRNTSLKNAGIISELDTVEPTVNINYPENNLINLNRNVDFSFKAADASKVEYCDFQLDNNLSERIYNLTNWQNYNLNNRFLRAGNHKWNIKCTDKHDNVAYTENRSITVIPLSNFISSGINLTNQNIGNISNLVLENPLEGKIQFLEGVNLSNGPDINQFVEIKENNITIHSEQIPELNKSAILTFYNVSYENPVILRDGQNCTECQIINSTEGFSFIVDHFSSYTVFGANITILNTSNSPADPAGNATAFAGNLTELIVSGYSRTQSWQGYFGNVSGTIQLADGNDNVMYNWTLANPEGEVYASMNSTITWGQIQCFNFTANGTNGAGNTPGTTNLNGINLSVLESQFSIASDDVDGINETFYLQNHDEFYASGLHFGTDECKSTRVYSNSGPIDQQFEEILLYEPNTASVVFASLLEEATVIGFNNGDNDFEMLVLENGHNNDVSASTYFFFVELE